MQAKLDEVIRAIDAAREQFIGIEHLTSTPMEEIRTTLEKEVGDINRKSATANDSVERVLTRY